MTGDQIRRMDAAADAEWEQGERETDADIAAGRVEHFDTAEKAIEWLREDGAGAEPKLPEPMDLPGKNLRAEAVRLRRELDAERGTHLDCDASWAEEYDAIRRRTRELEEALRELIKQVPRDMGFRAVDATLLTDDVERARRVLAEGEGER